MVLSYLSIIDAHHSITIFINTTMHASLATLSADPSALAQSGAIRLSISNIVDGGGLMPGLRETAMELLVDRVRDVPPVPDRAAAVVQILEAPRSDKSRLVEAILPKAAASEVTSKAAELRRSGRQGTLTAQDGPVTAAVSASMFRSGFSPLVSLRQIKVL